MANNTLQEPKLAISICKLIDKDIMLWSNIHGDGCSYTSQFEGLEWVVYCCKTSDHQRTLTISGQISPCTNEDVNTICGAINRQKMRQSVQQAVVDQALELLKQYETGI